MKSKKRSIVPKLKKILPDLKEKKIAVWGLAFKPKTDDMREAPATIIIEQLLSEGAKIHAFDPVAEENAKKIFPNIEYYSNPYDAIKECHGLIIVTEWNEFRNLDKKNIKELLLGPNIVDARNVYSPKEMRELGFNYLSIGRK